MLNKKILIVDDEQDIREIIRFYLEDSGYEVLEASNGKQAIELAQEYLPELITLDIIMPNIDGFQVIEQLKKNEKTKNIPIIILSVVADDKKYQHAIADYICKPFEREALLNAIETVLLNLGARKLRKILIVDDDKDIVDIIGLTLKGEGYITDCAFNGKEAIERIEKEIPDLVILDIMMPVMNGHEVINYLKSKEKFAQIPIVVLTGTHLSEDDKRSGISLGVSKYLSKPFSAKEIAEQIKTILKNKK